MHQIPGLHPGMMMGGAPLLPLLSLTEQPTLRRTISTINQIVVPSGVIAGDLIYIWHWGADVGGTPSTRTPAGFTNATNNTWSEGGLDMRWIQSVKLADGTEGGDTLNVMAAPGHLMVFRPNRPLKSMAVADTAADRSTGNPGSVGLTATTEPNACLAIAYYYTTGNSFLTPYGYSPTPDSQWHLDVFPGDRRFIWKFQTKPPSSNIIITGSSWSNRNIIGGVLLSVT